MLGLTTNKKGLRSRGSLHSRTRRVRSVEPFIGPILRLPLLKGDKVFKDSIILGYTV
jgi:hypothetical protein